MDWNQKECVDFNARKTQLVFFGHSSNFGAIDMKMDGSVLDEKSFKILRLFFSSKLDWESNIATIAKIAFNEIEAMICFMMFLLFEVVLHLQKSFIHTSWNTAIKLI